VSLVHPGCLSRPLVTSVFFLGSVPGVPCQTVLTGVVREDSSRRALAGVEVVLLGYGVTTTSDAAGRFVLGQLPVGYQVVLFRSVGYEPTWFRFIVGKKQDTTRAEATLIPFRAQQLEPIEVSARSRPPDPFDAFESRRRRGFGKFIDSATIRRNEFLSLESLLRRHTRIDARTVYIPSERRYEDWAISRRNRGHVVERRAICRSSSMAFPSTDPDCWGGVPPTSNNGTSPRSGPLRSIKARPRSRPNSREAEPRIAVRWCCGPGATEGGTLPVISVPVSRSCWQRCLQPAEASTDPR